MRIFAALLGVLAAAGTATAQESATALLEQGVALREHDRDAEALELFVRANEIDPSGQALAQIGLAHQALGHWVEAERFLDDALESRDAWVRRRRGPLDEALTTVRAHLGSLELSGGIDGADVLVNGEAAGTLPLTEPLRVPSGTVAIEVRADGYLPFQRNVEVPAEGTAREQIMLVVRSVERAGTSEQPAGPTEWSPGVLTWVGTPIAVVGLVGAAILGPIFLSERDAYIRAPTAEGADLAEALGISTDVAFAVAALGGILAIIGLATGTNTESSAADGGQLAIRF